MDRIEGGMIGFVGLGVMGEPMCRNLAQHSGRRIIGFDTTSGPLSRLAQFGVTAGAALSDLAERCEIIFLSLPSGVELAAVCEAPDGLLASMRKGQVLVDMSTSPVELTRRLAASFRTRGVRYADAPIARTRQAAEAGTLAITVGADKETFDLVEPLLKCCGTDVTHCGPLGCGQVVKLLNNMVLIETVIALSEALALGTRAGMNAQVLFEALSKGSADSFALRNHGVKAVLPGEFPRRAFSSVYALKDLDYALELAREVGVEAQGAQVARRLLQQAIDQGHGDEYWPVVSKVINGM